MNHLDLRLISQNRPIKSCAFVCDRHFNAHRALFEHSKFAKVSRILFLSLTMNQSKVEPVVNILELFTLSAFYSWWIVVGAKCSHGEFGVFGPKSGQGSDCDNLKMIGKLVQVEYLEFKALGSCMKASGLNNVRNWIYTNKNSTIFNFRKEICWKFNSKFSSKFNSKFN